MNTPALYAAVDSVLARLDTKRATQQRMYVTAIPARHLFVDHSYQRPLDEDRITKMVADFNPELLGVIDVSDRGDGTFAIVEGQHRWAAAREAHPEHDGVHLVCLVHTGLTATDEARLFHQIDVRRRSLSGWDRWKARRGAGDPVVAEIEAVVTGHGLLVDPAPRDRAVAATRALETVYELGGQQLLSNTLLVLTRAYRRARAATLPRDAPRRTPAPGRRGAGEPIQPARPGQPDSTPPGTTAFRQQVLHRPQDRAPRTAPALGDTPTDPGRPSHQPTSDRRLRRRTPPAPAEQRVTA